MSNITVLAVSSCSSQNPQASNFDPVRPECFSCLKPEQGDLQEDPRVSTDLNYLNVLSEAPEGHSISLSRSRTHSHLLYMADWGSTALQWQTHCSVTDAYCCAVLVVQAALPPYHLTVTRIRAILEQY